MILVLRHVLEPKGDAGRRTLRAVKECVCSKHGIVGLWFFDGLRSSAICSLFDSIRWNSSPIHGLARAGHDRQVPSGLSRSGTAGLTWIMQSSDRFPARAPSQAAARVPGLCGLSPADSLVALAWPDIQSDSLARGRQPSAEPYLHARKRG